MIKNTDNLNQYKNERFLNFYKKYEKEITPYIGKYEKTRIIYAILFTILAILSTVLFERIILLDFSLGTIISMGLFDFCVICLIYDKINFKFKNKIKQTFIPKIIQTLGEIHWNTDETIISDSIIEKSKLFESYNVRSNDDTFEGKYNGIEFKVSETNLSYESGSGDDRTVSTVFNGILILIDLNKETKAHTIIETKVETIKKTIKEISLSVLILWFSILLIWNGINTKNITALVGGIFFPLVIILCIIQNRLSKKQMMSMKLEDSDFNKKYIVKTEDQVEGRYLITTGFMDRFKNLQTAFGTKNIKCAFFDNKIMFALHTNKDFFELSGGLFHSLKHPKRVKSFYEETTAIYDIIDYFKLDEKTGL